MIRMKGKTTNRVIAVSLTAAMALAAAPTVTAADTAAGGGAIIYSTDFEDGDVSAFTNRGGEDTTVLSAEDVDGNKVLCADERTDSWNGPAFRLDMEGRCEAGTQYLVSAKVKGKYYTECTISYQYSDAGGEPHYVNLTKVSGSDWSKVKDLKVSFSEDVSDVYVYFEGGSGPIYVDDFEIKEGPKYEIQQDKAPLKDVYRDYFKVGTATTTMELSPKSTKDLIKKHFNSITLGNELKPDALLQKTQCQEEGDNVNPVISLASARTILNFARDNHIPVRGHVLVWHSQTPDWFFKEGFKDDGDWVSEEIMLQRMENYIKNVFAAVKEEYPDVDFYAWDVVNEAFTDQGSPRQPGQQGSSGSEQSAWVKVFGDNSFIPYAFKYARQYAPEGCKLYYNDYNEWSTGKTQAMLDLAKKLKAEGTLDGLGLQCHCDVPSLWPQAFQYDQMLTTLESAGVDLQVTEMDATICQQGNKPSSSDFEKQAKFYKEMFEVFKKHKDSLSAVVLWGTKDDQSWRSWGYPLLFEEDYEAKAAFDAIVDGMEVPEPLPTEPPTEKPTPAPTTEPTTGDVQPTVGPVADAFYGDANCDSKINVADAVAVLQYLANNTKYDLGAKGLVNADVDGVAGITGDDAITIQKVDASLIKQSDLPLSK